MQEIDCVTAGFPCQDISRAGKRVGLAGEHSGLLFQVLRLLDGRAERGVPVQWVVLENVRVT
jgi:DNA (cytosine-5)-methyltransferase 1